MRAFFFEHVEIAPTALQRAKLEIDHRLRRDIYVNCMVRSPERMLAMVKTIVREKPDVIAGYGQAIADLARFINSEGLRTWDTIPVVYGAERLWPHDRCCMISRQRVAVGTRRHRVPRGTKR